MREGPPNDAAIVDPTDLVESAPVIDRESEGYLKAKKRLISCVEGSVFSEWAGLVHSNPDLATDPEVATVVLKKGIAALTLTGSLGVVRRLGTLFPGYLENPSIQEAARQRMDKLVHRGSQIQIRELTEIFPELK